MLYLSACHQAQFITPNVELRMSVTCDGYRLLTHVDWEDDEKISFNTAIITFLRGLFY